jgi:hypothetical protein
VTRSFQTSAGVVPHIDQLTADNPGPDAGAQVTFTATGSNIDADPGRPDLVRWAWDITDNDNGGAVVFGPEQRAPGPFAFTFAAGHFHVHLVVSRDGATDDEAFDIAVTGRFDLTVNLAGAGTGRVTGSGLDCPGRCTGNFRAGDPVTLTAAPKTSVPFSTFGGWSSPCGGGTTCTFTITAAQTLTATFDTSNRLSTATVRFHTNDDDKDPNTRLTIELRSRAGVLVASTSGTFGTFGDGTDSGPINIPLTGAAADFESMPGGQLHLHVDPVGNDTWKFTGSLLLTFADGTAITGGTGNTSLSEDDRDGTYPV